MYLAWQAKTKKQSIQCRYSTSVLQHLFRILILDINIISDHMESQMAIQCDVK